VDAVVLRLLREPEAIPPALDPSGGSRRKWHAEAQSRADRTAGDRGRLHGPGAGDLGQRLKADVRVGDCDGGMEEELRTRPIALKVQDRSERQRREVGAFRS